MNHKLIGKIVNKAMMMVALAFIFMASSYLVDRSTCDRLTITQLDMEMYLNTYMLEDKAHDRAELKLAKAREDRADACISYALKHKLIRSLGIFDD